MLMLNACAATPVFKFKREAAGGEKGGVVFLDTFLASSDINITFHHFGYLSSHTSSACVFVTLNGLLNGFSIWVSAQSVPLS